MGKKSERQSKDSYDTLYDVGMHGRMEWIDGDCYRDVWRVGLIANNGVCLGLCQVDIRLVPSRRTPSDNDLLMIFPVFFYAERYAFHIPVWAYAGTFCNAHCLFVMDK